MVFSNILCVMCSFFLHLLLYWSSSHFPVKIFLLNFPISPSHHLYPCILFSRDPPTLWSFFTFLAYSLNVIHVFLSSDKPHHCLQLFHLPWYLSIIYLFIFQDNCQTPSHLWMLSYSYTDGILKISPETWIRNSTQLSVWMLILTDCAWPHLNVLEDVKSKTY